ncbi:transposase [Streptomyces sp. NPDC058773]|uniref:transposase n=1 Tax=Streptomyces sp. NPDC058773 TaxID=3346632 RepID=UPI00367A273B
MPARPGWRPKAVWRGGTAPPTAKGLPCSSVATSSPEDSTQKTGDERGLNVGRPPILPADKKFALVLRVVSGELTAAEAAREAGVSEQSVSNWRRQFIEGGRNGLAGESARASEGASRIAELNREIATLKATIGELYLELRKCSRSAAVRVPQPRGKTHPATRVK